MHGGKIDLESEIARGSKFIVSLPINPPLASPTRFISSAPPPRGDAALETT